MVERDLLWITKDTPLIPITQEISKVLGALCLEPGRRPNIHLLLYQNIIPSKLEWSSLILLYVLVSLVTFTLYYLLFICMHILNLSWWTVISLKLSSALFDLSTEYHRILISNCLMNRWHYSAIPRWVFGQVPPKSENELWLYYYSSFLLSFFQWVLFTYIMFK